VPVSARRPISVLAVDDNPDHLFLMQRRLRDAGVEVRTASDAETALDALDEVDIVLLDYRMPGVTGLELLKRIRAADGPSVVMVTGMGSEDVAVEAMRAGAIDYVVKNPGYLDALPHVVERAWRQHDLARRARELERIALLVTSAVEREDVFAEIVRGARRLLQARGCALFVASGENVVLEASDGDVGADADRLRAEATRVVQGPPDLDVVASGRDLFARLPSAEGERLGVLAMVAEPDPAFEPAEVRLARTFASFAGVALERVRRRELDRTLVEELQRMSDLRAHVVASVSHELRTPLTCIAGFADTLLGRWESLSETDRRGFVERIQHHSNDLDALVEGLLDLSAIESGRMRVDLQSLDLRPEVLATIEGLGPVLEDRRIEVDVSPEQVVSDRGLLHRALGNLLSNAVKYSEAGTAVTVRSVADARAVRVEVVDRGLGLSTQDAARAFEPFWRGSEATSRAMRGTGIGLALVKEYVRVMGGRVGVDSEPGSGSTFWFTLRREHTEGVRSETSFAMHEGGKSSPVSS
jgi:signal transduction histidine kinase/FixJ family two-component response regulator